MNEEAMTPDKEQVVEPLSAAEEAIARRTHRPTSRTVPFTWIESGEKDERVETSCARCEEEWPCGASRLLATLDAARTASVAGLDIERALRVVFAQYAIVPDRQFIDGPHVVVVGTSQEAAAVIAPKVARARTASVAGLDRERLAAALGDANKIIEMTRQHLSLDHPECSYNVLGIMNDESRRQLAAFNSALSIEQEPGEDDLLAKVRQAVAAIPQSLRHEDVPRKGGWSVGFRDAMTRVLATIDAMGESR